MAKIQVLERHVAELIAAGEVVERPSSVIKELFENAVDAGSSRVTVEIQNGGVMYMSVTDDGCGIAAEDVPTAFLRHATSKVRTEEDLTAIGTLGFRGEALASVAAVSRVELLTAAEGEPCGTRYRIEGGDEVLNEEAARPRGTTIVVRDLFYNVPARMKFLKKDVGEGNAVSGVMERLALSHPEVSVRFVRDGREEFLTPGNGDLKGAIYAVLGREFTASLIPVDYTLNGISVLGYIGKPSASRANRTMQQFYINGRYVKSKTMMAALEQGFKGSLMVGRFPVCVLQLTMPPEAVDANVHPAKLEVRFIQEKPVFDAVYYGVRSALNAGDRKVPPPAARPQEAETPRGEQLFFRTAEKTPPAVPAMAAPAAVSTPQAPPSAAAAAPAARFAGSEEPEVAVPPAAPFVKRAELSAGREPLYLRDAVSGGAPAVIPASLSMPAKAVSAPAEPAETPQVADAAAKPEATEPEVTVSAEPERPIRFVGEVFETYILVEYDGVLYVIDKHAAHERILYNEGRGAGGVERQLLLAPISVPLRREEYEVLIEEKDALLAAGFEMEDFGGKTLLLRSVPVILTGCDPVDVLQEIAGGLLSGKREITTAKQEWIAHSVACRAAVKAGNKNSPEELLALAKRVLTDDAVCYCPHGRPVCFRRTKREIEKLFGRV